jgi:hypothetical protein
MLHTSVAQIVSLSGTYTDSLPPSATCTYLVSGNITLQGNFHLNGLKFLCKSEVRRDKNLPPRVLGANIRLCNARITLENCTFASADNGMWGGIYLADSSSKLTLLQTEIRDSYHGIVQADSLSQIIAKHSWFYDNYISLQLAGKRDTVQHCVFTSKPSRMKMPFDSVAANDYYYSWAHIKNTANKELYLHNKNLVLNLFLNGIYAIFIDSKHRLQVQESHFYWHKIAAIYHQNGDLQLTNQNEIHLPTTLKNTIQMQTERRKQGFPDSTAYGIYAQNCKDELSEGNILSAEKTMQTIGYHGFDCDLISIKNESQYFRTAVMLEGTQDRNYSFVGWRFQNNETSIRINRSVASNISLEMYCNDFMSLPNTGTNIYPARTGIHLTGPAGTTLNVTSQGVSRLGGCETGTLTGSPVGSEVRNTVNDKDESETNPTPPLPANSTFNFRYINYQLGGLLQYYGYANENVSTVSNTNVQFRTCAGINEDYVLANKNTCLRTQVGVNYRKAAPVQQVSLLQNAPNPTRGITHISYTLPEDAVGKAQMVVYAPVSGKPMFSQTLQEVEGSIELNIKDWATGVYPYLLLIDGQVVQRNKLAVIK